MLILGCLRFEMKEDGSLQREFSKPFMAVSLMINHWISNGSRCRIQASL